MNNEEREKGCLCQESFCLASLEAYFSQSEVALATNARLPLVMRLSVVP